MYAIRRATLNEIIELRHDVLIVGTTRTSAAFTGDDEPTTLHVGAFDGERCVACASLMAAAFEGRPAHQLRGMAVDQAYRGTGLGGRLLQFCEQQVEGLLWCNAREHAVGFYERHGWATVGEPFEIEGVCMHLRMVRRRS